MSDFVAKNILILFIFCLFIIVDYFVYTRWMTASKKSEVEKGIIMDAVGNIFGSIYICDAKNDTSRMIKDYEWVNVEQQVKKYSEAIKIFAQKYLDEGDRDMFLNIMSLENIKNTLNPQNKSISMDCRYIGDEKPRWIRVVVTMTGAYTDNEFEKFVLALQDIHEEKTREIALREQTERALKVACDAANSANREKTVFLSKMSDDMRTPMNAIVGMTAIAETHIDNEKKIKDCLGKIGIASNHLLSLINEALDMSMVESGRVDLRRENFKISDLISTVVVMIKPLAKERKHTFVIDSDNISNDSVVGDGVRMQQILTNLLTNAVKYTPDGGKIELTVTEKDGSDSKMGGYEFVVQDNGIGMTEEFVRQIFEPFARAEDYRIDHVQGTGLGMAIVKKFICMMDGDIRVESEIDKGTKVTIMVYLERGDSDEQSVDVSGDNLNAMELLKSRDFTGTRILVAEDNELNREIATELLNMMGITVEVAKDGKEAVDMVEKSPEGYYDIIILDIQMPVMDGYKAACAIRSMNKKYTKDVPIYAMSANAFAKDIQDSLDAGMNEHIAKPLDVNRLYEVICNGLK